MKVMLVGLNATYGHTNLALRYIANYYNANCERSDSTLVNTREFSVNDRIDRIVSELFSENADVYGFSCYIWNIAEILMVSSDLKLIFPNCLIIFGGPEVSFETSDYFTLHKHVDYIIQGQGEKSFLALMSKLNSENKNNELPDNSERIIKGTKVRLEDKEFPYLTIGSFDPLKQYYYESSTGCPFACSYCLSSADTGVEFLSVERTIEELIFFIGKGARIVKLVDRTFNFNDTRAREIWKGLIEYYFTGPFETVFHFEISGDLFTQKTLELLSIAPPGIFRFECGIQSTNLETLKNVNRNTNLNLIFSNIKRIIESRNITVHLDLIAGLPGERRESLIKSFNEALALKPDMLQLGFLKMLKGSSIRNDAQKFGLIASAYPPYTIIETPDLSFGDIDFFRKIEVLLDRFYNSGLFKYSISFLLEKYFPDSPYDFFELLAAKYDESDGFERSTSRKECVELLFDIGISVINKINKEDINIFTDLMKFDYYLFDKKGGSDKLHINTSASHPGLSTEKLYKLLHKSNNFPLCSKPRVEHYSFDTDLLITQNRVRVFGTFVLYELSGNKPKIINSIAEN